MTKIVAASVALLFLALAVSGCTWGTKTEAVGPPPLPDPPFISSSGGVLATTLTAQPGTVAFNGQSYHTNLYNGQYIPPVWRVQPGDTIDLQLINAMSAPASSHASMANQSYTNLHYHGFNVPPTAPADDIFIQVFPQGAGPLPSSYDYSVPIPVWHPVGLFWFHPHPHGQSEAQVLGGMSGAAIVGDILQEYYPNLVGSRERVMLLKDFQASSDPSAPLLKTINGLPESSISIAPGEVQFWRFANIAADAFFDMQLQDLDGNVVPMNVIAVDGNPTSSIVQKNDLFLGAGARMEVLVVGPAAGSYVLKSLNVDTGPQGDPNPEVVLAQVTSSGSASRPMQPQEVAGLHPAKLDSQLSALRQWRQSDATPTPRSFVFSETTDGNTFFINNQTYDANRVDTVIQFPVTEEWTLTNPSGELHVFHIHQLDFLVESINGFVQPDNGVQDTITLPVGGVVKILIPFTQATILGEFVYHCHILGHEDNGMMANIVVQQ